MKALITGANGFLGGWLARLLLERGDSVRALVRAGHALGGLEGLGVEVARGDVTQPDGLAEAVRGCDTVFHLAGIRRSSVRDDFVRVNVDGTRHVLDAAVAAGGVRRFVLVGSLAAAGPSREGKAEDAPFDPREWYGESKAEAERLTLSYAGRLPVTVARPPRIVGPGDHENLFFFKLVKKGFVLGVSGEPRPLSFIDVEDCARGLVALAEKPEAVGHAFFLASPERTDLEGLQLEAAKAMGAQPRVVRLWPWVLRSAAATADVVSRTTGRKLPLNKKLALQLLAPGWTCEVGKAQRLLGFEATVPLSASMKRTADWYREQGWL